MESGSGKLDKKSQIALVIFFEYSILVTVHTPLFLEVFLQKYAKSRDIQAKIPLSQVIWNEFLATLL